MQLLSREQAPAATYAWDFRSKGRSVRIPNRMSAAAHLCGGSTLVKISAACSSAQVYSRIAASSLNTSERHDKFTLIIRSGNMAKLRAIAFLNY